MAISLYLNNLNLNGCTAFCSVEGLYLEQQWTASHLQMEAQLM